MTMLPFLFDQKTMHKQQQKPKNQQHEFSRVSTL